MTPFLPSATTRAEGVAPGTSTRIGPDPPRSTSPESSACQFDGANQSAACPLNAAPAPSRSTASCWPQLAPPGALPVVTKIDAPSDAMPPGPQIPLSAASVAYTEGAAGLSIGTATTHPW